MTDFPCQCGDTHCDRQLRLYYHSSRTEQEYAVIGTDVDTGFAFLTPDQAKELATRLTAWAAKKGQE